MDILIGSEFTYLVIGIMIGLVLGIFVGISFNDRETGAIDRPEPKDDPPGERKINKDD